MTTHGYASLSEAIAASVLGPQEVARIRQAWPNLVGIDRWRRDPDLGLVERSYVVPPGAVGWSTAVAGAAGLNGSAVTATIETDGKRRMSCHGERAARINSYGDSFTHGDQVNDGETWQEYLAAHLRESIRNFGRGGASVYETYLRMKREEATANAAEYVLFYLWGDDHVRSLLGGSLHLNLLGMPGMAQWRTSVGFATPYLRIDPVTGAVTEHPSLIPTVESVDHLANPEWYRQHIEHDLVTQLMLFGGHPATEGQSGGGVIASIDEGAVGSLAATLGLEREWASATDRQATARQLLDRYALRTSTYLIDEAVRFAATAGKKIMFLLLDPFRSVKAMVHGRARYDQPIVDHLESIGARYFDMTQVHVDDFRARGETWPRYLRHHFVEIGGHYSPQGNHYFAFSLLPHLLDWLEPKPAPYHGARPVVPQGYVFNGRFGGSTD